MPLGELHVGTYAPSLETRGEGLARASNRWGRLAYGAALAFVAQMYANPAFWWPELEKARLGVVAASICAFAVVMRRITSGERLRFGGPPVALLFAYAATVPASLAWSIAPDRTLDATIDIAKLLVIYVALVNALDEPGRLRKFLLVGAIASLAPSTGAVMRWIENDQLINGYRSYWRGTYADPNHCAMGLVLVLPATIIAIGQARRPWLKALLAFSAVSNVAAIVVTHSRSGAVALAVALTVTLLRGRRKFRGLAFAAVGVAGLIALAPQSFWKRSESIADYAEDASFNERERAWAMFKVIAEERPLSGVGAGGFVVAWDRYAPLNALGQRLIAHNIFMEIQGEQGAIALLLFAAFSTWLLVRLWGAGNGDGPWSADARAVFGGLAGYLICELVNGLSRTFDLYLLFAAAIVALAHARVRARLAAEAASP